MTTTQLARLIILQIEKLKEIPGVSVISAIQVKEEGKKTNFGCIHGDEEQIEELFEQIFENCPDTIQIAGNMLFEE